MRRFIIAWAGSASERQKGGDAAAAAGAAECKCFRVIVEECVGFVWFFTRCGAK